jgi:hypothetical protein
MMLDVAVMVLDLEISKTVSNINVCRRKGGAIPIQHIYYDGYKLDIAICQPSVAVRDGFNCMIKDD